MADGPSDNPAVTFPCFTWLVASWVPVSTGLVLPSAVVGWVTVAWTGAVTYPLALVWSELVVSSVAGRLTAAALVVVAVFSAA